MPARTRCWGWWGEKEATESPTNLQNQLAFFFFFERNIFPNRVKNLKSLASVHQTNLFDESVQWKPLPESHGLQRNHLIQSILWKKS